MKAIILVLDSVGIGAAPDAGDYGDAGSDTLGHIATAVGGLKLPVLGKMGLGCIPPILSADRRLAGVPPTGGPLASFGAMRELSRGKDTTTGHWEMAGLIMRDGFHLFPHEYPSFPADLIAEFERRTGRKTIGNKAASGVEIIKELGPRQMETGEWIVYTSADSVFQIAAHEKIIPIKELYRGCEIARELCNPLQVGRVIARPFIGAPGNFTRTGNRRDFSYPLPDQTVLDNIRTAGHDVVSIGKIDDIFAGSGITKSYHSESNQDAMRDLATAVRTTGEGLIFANFVDFDMLYGHRRNAAGYAAALQEADRYIGDLIPALGKDDMFIVTADHGNDPTFRGTDHTREHVPLLVLRPGRPGRNLGIRNGFHDIAQSLASFFSLPPMPGGISFL